jgi:hypothetical protein
MFCSDIDLDVEVSTSTPAEEVAVLPEVVGDA